jgi:sigma-E factor negative regulatory protein RseA
MLPIEFLGEVRSRLQQEQRVRAPAQGKAANQEPAGTPRSPLRAAANDASFRWKLVAGVASLTAVAAIAWNVAGAFPGKPQEAQLAAGQRGTVLAGQQGGVMIRDPRLDEFLAAHRQLGGASALQMPAGFLRNATFEGANR